MVKEPLFILKSRLTFLLIDDYVIEQFVYSLEISVSDVSNQSNQLI
jgi:hypothetical protein